MTSRSVWEQEKPIWCLAPMEGVTDSAFRQVVAAVGRPKLFFTEFTSVDGLFSKGEAYVAQRLHYTPTEQPLIAQIWGMVPENYRLAGAYLVKKGFSGVDINMGCPDRTVIAKGAGSALIKQPQLAAQFIRELKVGLDGAIPVSVKIRIGFDRVETESWAKWILDQDIDALSVHGRTTKQLSKVPANWEEIAKVVAIRDEMGVKTKIIGNGDVKTLAEARKKVTDFGVDGVMIGRGILENPLLFNEAVNYEAVTSEKRVELLVQHMHVFARTWQGQKPFHVLRKYFKIYLKDFRGAGKLREEMMRAENAREALLILKQHGFNLPSQTEYVYA